MSATDTTALTVTPPALPPELDLPSFGGGLVTSAISFAAGILWLRRRYSRDNTEVAKDKAESNILEVLQHERDLALSSAREAWCTRAQDAKLIGELSTKVSHLTELNETLRGEIQELRHEMQELRKFMCSTDCPKRTQGWAKEPV